MQISNFQLLNYKSYRDSGEIQLSTGFNVLAGQNNAGKSTMLEALGLKFLPKPHKSLLTLPRFTSPVDPNSRSKVTLSATGEEIKDIMLSLNGDLFVPVPNSEKARAMQAAQEVLQRILSTPTIYFRVSLVSNQNQTPNINIEQFPSHGIYESEIQPGGKAAFYVVQANASKINFNIPNDTIQPLTNDFGITVCHYLRERIYSFRAERFNMGVSPVGTRNVLESNAANLPEVLSVLQGNNPSLFAKFNEYVRQIFPTVYQVSVRNIANNQLEVILWTENPSSQRDDLAVPLSESGTGVGQVLAILFVVLTSQFPRTFLIDEPNSFLHPAAARKLIEILKIDFPQHQYIVATHSPEIIRTADPTSLFMVRMDGRESRLEHLDSKDVRDQGKYLLEVGARLSDVFGADEIVWVEGDTEEACFRLIVRDLLKKPLLGRTIAAVRNVGDFEGKRPSAKIIWEIYSQLSKSNALIPPAIAFVFDREQRTEAERNELVSRSNGMLKFLPRRMYENYILVPEALAAVLLTLPSFQSSDLTVGHIREWLTTNGGKPIYLTRPLETVDITSPVWLENVDGAKLLRDLFTALSENKEEYRKTVHSVQLTEWLINNQPISLDELTRFLSSILAP